MIASSAPNEIVENLGIARRVRLRRVVLGSDSSKREELGSSQMIDGAGSKVLAKDLAPRAASLRRLTMAAVNCRLTD
jgi:hypothetical protein